MDKNPFAEIVALFNKLSLPQRLVIGGGVGLTIILLGVLLTFLNEPNYSTLYTNLEESDASKVVDALNSKSIPFKLENGGSKIKVPDDLVYETRLSLSEQGIPNSGVVGYEIFDQNTMGMSKFLQQLNYKRALEGELSRTIMQIDGIEGVRVHIVTPEKTVFKDEEKPATASVVLKLRNNSSISQRHVNSIMNLVAGSVEGLHAKNITIIDARGKLLSGEKNDNSIAASSSKQYEIKQHVENYLANKAQSILDNVLGYGNAIIKVDADLNFNQVEKTIESFDPESQVAVSEQLTKTQQNQAVTGDSSIQASENNITNYEINKTVQRVVEGSGNIAHLSVAAVINDERYEEMVDGVKKTNFKPRSEEQMQKLEDIIKNAVGIVKKRSDQFSIVNLPFETHQIGAPDEEEFNSQPSLFEDWDRLTKLLMILLAIGASLFIVKRLMKSLKDENIVIGTVNPTEVALQASSGSLTDQLVSGETMNTQLPPVQKKKKRNLPINDLEDEISDEAAVKKLRHDKISNYVKKNPIDAAKMINTWLHEDEF